MAKPNDFETNVFVNCPFDVEYRPLLEAMVFTIVACGFRPCLALEEKDAGAIRLDKIKKLIGQSRLCIHDISRISVDQSSGLPRFNMPFELGIDMGARLYGMSYLKRKRLLIFDKELYRYRQYLSDIAGQDISAHFDTECRIIERVRDWLNGQRSGGPPLLGARRIRESLADFRDTLPVMCEELHLDHSNLDFNDYLFYVSEWIRITA